MFIISKTMSEGALIAQKFDARLIDKMSRVLESLPLLADGVHLVVPFSELPDGLALPFGTDIKVSMAIMPEDGFTQVITEIMLRSGLIADPSTGPRISYFTTRSGSDDIRKLANGFVLDHPRKISEAVARLNAGDHIIASMALFATGFRTPENCVIRFHPECAGSKALFTQCLAHAVQTKNHDAMAMLRGIAADPGAPIAVISRDPDLTEDRLDAIKISIADAEGRGVFDALDDDRPEMI